MKHFYLDRIIPTHYNGSMKKNRVKNQFQIEKNRDFYDTFLAEKYWSNGYYSHFHQCMEVYCVQEGAVNVTVNNTTFELNRGQAVVINSLTVHSYQCDREALISFFLIGEKYLEHFNELYPNHMIPIFLDDIEGNIPIFSAISSICLNGKEFSELDKYSAVDHLLSVIIRRYPPIPFARSKSSVLSSIVQYIYDNCEQDLNLETLAKQFHYTPMTMSHLFSKGIGIDLRVFINDVRLQKVLAMKHDPKYTDISLINLAMMCGFNSASTFYRTYRRNNVAVPKASSVFPDTPPNDCAPDSHRNIFTIPSRGCSGTETEGKTTALEVSFGNKKRK